MKDYRITDCQSKTLGFNCTCSYCTYLKTEYLKYFDDTDDCPVAFNSRNWLVAKLMELEDRISILEAFNAPNT